jgi:hypothetical protein
LFRRKHFRIALSSRSHEGASSGSPVQLIFFLVHLSNASAAFSHALTLLALQKSKSLANLAHAATPLMCTHWCSAVDFVAQLRLARSASALVLALGPKKRPMNECVIRLV